jgi:hypothetical protein
MFSDGQVHQMRRTPAMHFWNYDIVHVNVYNIGETVYLLS